MYYISYLIVQFWSQVFCFIYFCKSRRVLQLFNPIRQSPLKLLNGLFIAFLLNILQLDKKFLIPQFIFFYISNLILNFGNFRTVFGNLSMNSAIYSLYSYNAFYRGVIPYILPISLSHPFFNSVFIASRLWLATAIIRGVFPSQSPLLILAPCIKRIYIIGNLFFIAANCRAVRLYFLSIGLFMSNFGFFNTLASYQISSKVMYLRVIYQRECGQTVRQRECQAIFDVGLLIFFMKMGSGSQIFHLGRASYALKLIISNMLQFGGVKDGNQKLQYIQV